MVECPTPIAVTVAHPGSRIVTDAELLAWEWIDQQREPYGTWVGTIRDRQGRVRQCPGRMLRPAGTAAPHAGCAPDSWEDPAPLASVVVLADYRRSSLRHVSETSG